MNPAAVFLALVVWTVASVCLTAWVTTRACLRVLDERNRPHPSNPAWTPSDRDLMQQRSKDFYQ